MQTVIVTVEDGEYRVPGPQQTEAQAYYTDDKQDAIGTAKAIYGQQVAIKFRRLRAYLGG